MSLPNLPSQAEPEHINGTVPDRLFTQFNRVVEFRYTGANITMFVTRLSAKRGDMGNNINVTMTPDEVRKLLELVVWADSAREVMADAQKKYPSTPSPEGILKELGNTQFLGDRHNFG